MFSKLLVGNVDSHNYKISCGTKTVGGKPWTYIASQTICIQGQKSFSRNDMKFTTHNPKISPAAPQKLLVGKPDSHIFQIFFVGKLISHCPVFSLGSGLPFVFRFFSSNVVHFVCVSPCSTFFVYVLVQKPLQLQRNSQNTVVSTLLMKTEGYCTCMFSSLSS